VSGDADLESFDFAELAFAFGFADPVDEVVAVTRTDAPSPSRPVRTATIDKPDYQCDIILIGDRMAGTTAHRRHPDERTQRQHRCERPARVVANSPATRHAAPDRAI
jgi:hypothetical protein